MRTGIQAYLVKQKTSPYWHMRYTVPGHKERSRSLRVRGEKAANKLMHEFVRQLEDEEAGIIAPSRQRETASANLETVLNEYLADLRAQNCAAQYVEKTGMFIRVIARTQNWLSIRDISAESFTAWRSKLAGKRAAKTLNLYLGAMLSFLNWLVNTDRRPDNPLRKVPKVKEFEQKRPRRACTDEEATMLLHVAPPERRLIYLIALHTGLRRSEIATLEWRDVHLDEADPFIQLRATPSKNRKGAVVWLHGEACEALKDERKKGVRLSDRVVQMFRRLDAFKKDLKSAGIVYEDEFGRRFDLHAARKTFNTRMAVAGVQTRAAMHAMRHSEEGLTTKVYTDKTHLAVARHVCALPPLLPGNSVSAIVSGNRASRSNSTTRNDTIQQGLRLADHFENEAFSYALTLSDTRGHNEENGSGGWDRTNDLVNFTSEVSMFYEVCRLYALACGPSRHTLSPTPYGNRLPKAELSVLVCSVLSPGYRE
jgi:integrase